MLNTLYLTLTASPTGAVDVACSEPRLALPHPGAVVDVPGRGFAKAAVHTLAWEMLAFAALKGGRVGGNVAAERVNPVLLLGFAKAFLDPEQLGFAVDGHVRDMARQALGMPAVESYLCPGWQPRNPVAFSPALTFADDTVKEEEQKPFCCGLKVETVRGNPDTATDWSAA